MKRETFDRADDLLSFISDTFRAISALQEALASDKTDRTKEMKDILGDAVYSLCGADENFYQAFCDLIEDAREKAEEEFSKL